MNIIAVIFTIVSLTSCDRFLDREVDSYMDLEKTYTSYERTSQAVTNIYRFLPDGLNRIGSAMYDAATDDAESTIETCNIKKFNIGSWNSQDNPDDMWNRFYRGIRAANELLENVHKVDLSSYRDDPDNQTEYKKRLKDIEMWQGEAYFLRAFLHFELVKRYGPVPYITHTLEVAGDHKDIRRPEMDDVISAIVSDCDKAAGILEVTPWRDVASAYGKATKGAALALKSRALLYAASPLYLDWRNLDENYLPSDPQKWKAAADAAMEVINLGEYVLYASYGDLFKNNISNKEFIFQKRLTSSVSFEQVNSPVSYGGTGGTTPTLNLMEAYELRDGSPFCWETDVNAAHPFTYRDRRLSATFLLNGDKWKDSVVETFDGGKDASGITNATKTGFYVRKFMNESVNVQTGGNTMGHVWPYIRLAEIYLNYAEAVNEYNPGSEDILIYLNKVRVRAGQPRIKTVLSQEEMREKIRNERRVELAFEEQRAWDVRRWKTASKTLGADARGLEIIPDETKGAQRSAVKLAAIPENEVPEGWFYYDGDEFNKSYIDDTYWGLYGADGPVGNQFYGQSNGSIHTYRTKQVSAIKEDGTTICRISSTRDDNPPYAQLAPGAGDRPGWWSGAISSRDTDKYGNPAKFYPLFCRIEIRMRTPYKYGIWHAPWCRYYAGAQYAELDIEEFFIKTWIDNPNLGRKDKFVLSQALHLHDNDKGATASSSTLLVNVNGYSRHFDMPSDPMEDWHVYGVQVDPDPDAPQEHAIISFLYDGQVTNTTKTKDYGNRLNEFVLKAFREGCENAAWDFAFTAQIGGKDENGIGYPEDMDKDLRNVHSDIDWVRCFTRAPQDPDAIEEPQYPEHEGYVYKQKVVSNRVWESKNYWYPIPETEILQTGWKQNPNW